MPRRKAVSDDASSRKRARTSPKPKKLSGRDAAMTSQRRLRAALREPGYDTELVPRAARDLSSSTLERIDGNEAWNLAEMVLLCNEAAWRQGPCEPRADPKPLMLEYISDRVDTDDPLWGYVVRSQKQQWLQGFVAVTVFTTWTPYFRFTCTAPSAAVTAADLEWCAVDDALACELETARRAGDPEQEGVVWPRVAEISLLGGIGAGKNLLGLVLDELRESGRFDYCVLQATDQAIPFYERMGFARVGAVASCENDDLDAPLQLPPGGKLYWARRLSRALLRRVRALDDHGVFAEPVDESVAPDYYTKIKDPVDLSTVRRRLVEGADLVATALAYLPEHLEADLERMFANCAAYNNAGSPIVAYAKRVERHVKAVLNESKAAKPQLWGLSSQLEAYSDAKLRNEFEAAADADVATVMGYVHWTFPDQPVEDQYPSYLMGLRLRDHAAASAMAAAADCALRNAGAASDAAAACVAAVAAIVDTQTKAVLIAPPRTPPTRLPVLEHAVSKLTYENAVPAPMAPKRKRIVPRSNVTPRGRSFTVKVHRGGPAEYLGTFPSVPEAQAAYDDAIAERGWDTPASPSSSAAKKPLPEPGAFLACRDEWLAHPALRTSPLKLRVAMLDAAPDADPEVLRDLAAAYDDEPEEDDDDEDDQEPKRKARALYNKVVTVTNLPPAYAYDYWFVYHYVPDMEWCHICPMEPHGVFGPNSKRNGRPRWRLVPEGQAREIDVAAYRCTPVKHETVAKTQSADKEIFDIFESTAPA